MSDTDPAQESLAQWNAVAPAWDKHRERLFENTRAVSEWLVEQVDPRPGQTLLELTCGPGETGFLAAAKLGAEGRLISSDFVPAMVDAAERGAAERGLDNVEARVIDASDIDLPDDRVDGVLSRFGLMLVPEQQRALGEIRRVLRPGGRFAYATWGPAERNPWVVHLMMVLVQNGFAPPGDPAAAGGIFSLADPDRNRELVTAAGFDEVVVEEVAGVMRFDDADEYWTVQTSVAGPVAAFAQSLGGEQLDAVRAMLDPSLEPFRSDDGLALPWVSTVTRAS